MFKIKINEREIGNNFPPFFVAELSANHNQTLARALALVEAAKSAGADAVKLQTYTPDTMTLDIRDGSYYISDPKSLWQGRSLYELYQEAATPWEWHEHIFKRCRELGLIYFSSPFDKSAVDFLETLDVPCYKLASLEINDHELIKKIASTKKPILISTGAATLNEISEAIEGARTAGSQEILILKCTSAYPTEPKDLHIKTIPHLAEIFQVPVGLSDHSMGIGAAIASIALGGCLVEKHFTLSRADGGVDDPFSLEPEPFKRMVEAGYDAWQSLGHIQYGPLLSEATSLSLRRTLHFVRNLLPGETVSREDIKAIRPGGGLAPKYLDVLVGMKLIKPVLRGQPVTWDSFQSKLNH